MRSPAQNEQSANQNRLQHYKAESPDNSPLVLLPHRGFAESNYAVWRQIILSNAPALKLAPVEHGHKRRFFDRDIRGPSSACKLQCHFRELDCPGFPGPNVAT